MQIQNRKHRSTQAESLPIKRQGFSLVELMIVLIIIAILLGLLFPAISKAITTGRNATVTTEVSNLEKAIGEFKLKFGVEPPSRFYLYEDASDWSNTDLRTRESQAFIRQVWPNFDFTYADAPTAGELDINGDGSITSGTAIDLRGAECLVFFLGGVCATEDASGNSIRDAAGVSTMSGTPAKWFPLGFSSNPEMPFARGTGTRVGPFFEFDPSRIVNVPGSAANRSMPEYLDAFPGQTSPYLYASSYEGRGYNVSGTSPSLTYSDLNLGTSSITEPTYVYIQSGTPGSAGAVPYNKTTFQIISPGIDTDYGTGGTYDREDGFTGFADAVQKDNITNFSGGVLDAN